MRIKFRLVDGVVCASFTSPEIREIGGELTQLPDAAVESKKLLLSFRDLTYMSSGMIGALMLLNKKVKHHGIQL